MNNKSGCYAQLAFGENIYIYTFTQDKIKNPINSNDQGDKTVLELPDAVPFTVTITSSLMNGNEEKKKSLSARWEGSSVR